MSLLLFTIVVTGLGLFLTHTTSGIVDKMFETKNDTKYTQVQKRMLMTSQILEIAIVGFGYADVIYILGKWIFKM